MGKFLALLVLLVAIAIAVIFSGVLQPDTDPPPEKDGWFGRGSPQPEDDKTIRKFRVDIPEDVLSDLRRRLNNTRLGEDLENMDFEYGFQVNYMKEVLEYWKTKYDWRKHEKEINKYPQFKTRIEGIDVHFIHVKAKTKSAKNRVLLITHGWPGSVWEFYKIIPMLTDPAKFGGKAEDAFEIICPSIGGYGFSEAPHQVGFNVLAMARINRKLMERLGHKQFFIQGGDWGSLISTAMVQVYPEKILGVHLNMQVPRQGHLPTILKQVIGNYFPSLVGITPEEYTNSYPLSKVFIKLLKALGYFHLQATKPDTVAFALTDSPVGLAAYILEKFSGWTEGDVSGLPDGGLTKKFTLDDLLTNVMIYWVTGNIGPSMRFYKENIGSQEIDDLNAIPVNTPTALAYFPEELYSYPRVLLEARYRNIIQCNYLTKGGHFAAMEQPEILAKDIFEFVERVENLNN